MSTTSPQLTDPAVAVAVLDVDRQFRATEKAVVEAALGDLPGVVSVEANPVGQTAIVRYDPSVISLLVLRRAVERCGFESAGCNVPGCLCDPLHEPGRPEPAHDEAAAERAHAPGAHGEGGHAGHSMDRMAIEMRNRFILSLLFTLAILAWAIGYNSLAIPIAAGILDPVGFTLSPAVGALSVSGSSVIVAINAIALRRLRLPGQRGA